LGLYLCFQPMGLSRARDTTGGSKQRPALLSFDIVCDEAERMLGGSLALLELHNLLLQAAGELGLLLPHAAHVLHAPHDSLAAAAVHQPDVRQSVDARRERASVFVQPVAHRMMQKRTGVAAFAVRQPAGVHGAPGWTAVGAASR
jgi:hypothetical protein